MGIIPYTVGSDDKIAYDYGPLNNCWGTIFSCAINPKAAALVSFKRLDQIPYDKEIVEKWMDNLSELGFPIKTSYGHAVYSPTEGKIPVVKWTTKFSDYKNKVDIQPLLAYNFGLGHSIVGNCEKIIVTMEQFWKMWENQNTRRSTYDRADKVNFGFFKFAWYPVRMTSGEWVWMNLDIQRVRKFNI